MKKNIIYLFLITVFACSRQKIAENAIVDTVPTPSMHILSENIRDTSNFLQRDSLLNTWYKHLLDISNTGLNFSSQKNLN